MPELIVQTLYAILTSLAIAIATVKVVAEHIPKLQFKPFTCVYCMTVWAGLAASIAIASDVPTAIAMWPVAHIGAYILYQKAI